MLAVEFDEIKRILNGRYKICDDQTEVVRWFEALKPFDFSVAKEAVNDWIINDGWKPETANIVDRCKDVIRWRKQIQAANNEDPNAKAVSCPYCRDTGLVVKTSPTGVLVGTPCQRCKWGKLKYPWYFMTEAEKREYNEREIKAGRSVPKYLEAPKEFYLKYVYGTGENDEATKQPVQTVP